ncbi:MAG TPA: hypothetical protein ENJ35_10175 [Gammaproteobacteria bacterium]|nr:hypothetical protein [Gammaproteobacteria bacterium]
MSGESDNTKTPSEELTDKIVKALGKEGLLKEDDLQGMAPTIASGKVKAEDWRVMVEKAIDRGKGGE